MCRGACRKLRGPEAEGHRARGLCYRRSERTSLSQYTDADAPPAHVHGGGFSVAGDGSADDGVGGPEERLADVGDAEVGDEANALHAPLPAFTGDTGDSDGDGAYAGVAWLR